MRRCWGLLFLALGGCSTAPVAGLMDCLVPSRAPKGDRTPDRDDRPPLPDPFGPARPRDESRPSTPAPDLDRLGDPLPPR